MKKLDTIVSKFTAFVGGVTFVAMILVIVGNVFARLIFMKSFAWAEEIAYLLLNWAVFMGVCHLYKTNGLVAIDVLVNVLPASVKRIVMLVVYGLMGILNVGLIVWSFDLAMATWNGRMTPILKIPFFWYYIVVTIAGVILTVYSVVFIYKIIKNEDIEETALQDRA